MSASLFRLISGGATTEADGSTGHRGADVGSGGTISLRSYRSNTDRFFSIFLILIFFFWSRPTPIIHLNMAQPSVELILLYLPDFRKR